MSKAAGSGIVQRFLAFLRAHDLTGETIGIAISGGPDSTALAIAASEAARAKIIRPVAIHVDHGIRPDSATDFLSIRQTCAELELELRSVRAQLPADASEDLMRTARFRLIAAEIGELGGSRAMTAHHASDQAETVLLHLIRGSGLEGVAGIAALETFFGSAVAPGLTVLRPFLLESRATLLDLVASVGLPYLTDPTNTDHDKARNSVRLDVMPRLEHIHAGAGEAIARFAQIARDENDALQLMVQSTLGRHVGDGSLNVRTVRAEPVAVQRRLIRHWINQQTGLELTWNRTEALRAAIASDQGGTMIELGEQWVAARKGELLHLSKMAIGNEG